MRTLPTLLCLLACVPALRAESAPTPAPATVSQADAEYLKKIDERATGIVAKLQLTDEAKASTVKAIVAAQYVKLREWQEANESQLKTLRKDPALKDQAEALLGTRKKLREAFLKSLGEHLTGRQIDVIKDGMTYGKVQFTWNGYLNQNPWLNEEEKARVLTWLLEARDEAIDGGSADEKSDIFNRYKGKIANYLAKRQQAKPAKK